MKTVARVKWHGSKRLGRFDQFFMHYANYRR
jgi:hypothetical protein